MPQYSDALFRQQFPEFADTTKYPQALVSMYWATGQEFISTSDSPCNALNGSSLALALNYMAAHLLALGLQAAAAGPGGPGSSQSGFVTSATIDKISVQTLAPPAKDGWQWWLAQTSYGQALWALLKVKSVGGMTIGGLPERTGFRKIGGVFW